MDTMDRDDVTFLPGFGNDISGRFAHHLGNIQRTVGLFSYGDGTKHSFRLHLKHKINNTHSAHMFNKVYFVGNHIRLPDVFQV